MPPAVRQRLEIRRPAQLAALTSPVRIEILEQFGLGGPCSVADVAEHLERAPDSLYYHVRMLVRVGLLEALEEPRLGNGRPETLYRLPALELEVPRKTRGAARVHTRKAIHTVLRLAGRELDAALDDPEVADEGPRRRLYGRRMRGRLTQKALREVNEHISAIEAVFAREQARRGRPGGQACAVTLVLTPGATGGEG